MYSDEDRCRRLPLLLQLAWHCPEIELTVGYVQRAGHILEVMNC